MDKDLKDILTYGFGTLVGYIVLFSFLVKYVQDINLIIIYTILLIIVIWQCYIQIKISKGGENE